MTSTASAMVVARCEQYSTNTAVREGEAAARLRRGCRQGIRLAFRSDSIVSLVHQSPAPDPTIMLKRGWPPGSLLRDFASQRGESDSEREDVIVPIC